MDITVAAALVPEDYLGDLAVFRHTAKIVTCQFLYRNQALLGFVDGWQAWQACLCL